MRYKIVAPKEVQATIQLPASKSISNRVLIIHSLCKAKTSLRNLSDCDDTSVMLSALSEDKEWVDIKAAGTAMRFLTAYFSIQEGRHILTGTERMRNRPIKILVEALRSLGAQIEYLEKDGFPPLKITGRKLQGGEVTLDGSVSSQYISALLMIAPLMEKGLTIYLSGTLISRPYVHLTLSLMKEFGIECNWKDSTIAIAPQDYQPKDFCVESDWSAASYWYEIAALSKFSQIELLGLNKHSYQGDSHLVEIFEQLGVSTRYTEQGVCLKKNKDYSRKLIYNFVDQPDLAQTFVVTSVMKGIPFHFVGLQTLKIKETDRINALITELKKWGFLLRDSNNSTLEWNGERVDVVSESIDTYEDHRMALAFAPASLLREQVIINNPEVISKSYPTYWEDLKKAGFIIQEEQ